MPLSDLAQALVEWRDAGGNPEEVANSIRDMINEAIELQMEIHMELSHE